MMYDQGHVIRINDRRTRLSLGQPTPAVPAAAPGSDMDRLSVDQRLARLAKLGTDNPAKLDSLQIQKICWALSVYYAQMGIE